METFWFFLLRRCRADDVAYDSEFWFSQCLIRSYDSIYDFDADSDSEFLKLVASENHPKNKKLKNRPMKKCWNARTLCRG